MNEYKQVDPTIKATGVYWVAVKGKCMAVIPSNVGQSCIASVEQDMCELHAASRGWLQEEVYVIWQPQNCSLGTWKRWQAKWSKRTSPAPIAA